MWIFKPYTPLFIVLTDVIWGNESPILQLAGKDHWMLCSAGRSTLSEDIIKIMKKTIGFAVACTVALVAGEAWAFGFGSTGPSAGNSGPGAGNYEQRPYGANPRSGSGGGFGGGPSSNAPRYGSGYGPGPNTQQGPGVGGYGGDPRTPRQGPGYGGYQQGPGYGAPPQGYGYPPGPAAGYGAPPQAQEEYDIPRDSYGQQYQPIPGYGGYPQAPAPGYGYPPPGYPGDYYPNERSRGDRDSGGFPNPMNMMKNPMDMFGGSRQRD